MKMGRKHAAVGAVALALAGLEHQRAGAVAEEHAGRAVLPVEDAGEGLGPDHQRVPRLPGLEEVVGDGERVDEAGADRLHVEGGAPGVAEHRLHPGRGRGEGLVRGRRRQHDEVEIGAADARAGKRDLARFQRHVGGTLAVGGDVALAHAGALRDPFVGCIDDSLEIPVGENPLRQVGAAADDRGAQDHQSTAALGSGCSSPFRRSNSSLMRSLKPPAAMSTATPMALANPMASVPP